MIVNDVPMSTKVPPGCVFVRCPYPVVTADEAIDHFETLGSVVRTSLERHEDGFMRGYGIVVPK